MTTALQTPETTFIDEDGHTSNAEPLKPSNHVTISPNAASPENSALNAIAAAAANPAIDVEKLKELIKMQRDELAYQARAAFATDFARMKPKLPTVARTRKNTHTNSNYAPLEEINETIDPILGEYGFATSAKITGQTENTVTITAELWHKGGHVESNPLTLPLDNAGTGGKVNKTGVQATASSITYAKRVAICALLNISTGDDQDGNRAEQDDDAIDIPQAVEIDELIKMTKSDKARFLKHMGVNDVREIRAKDYAKAKNALNEKQKAMQNNGVKP